MPNRSARQRATAAGSALGHEGPEAAGAELDGSALTALAAQTNAQASRKLRNDFFMALVFDRPKWPARTCKFMRQDNAQTPGKAAFFTTRFSFGYWTPGWLVSRA